MNLFKKLFLGIGLMALPLVSLAQPQMPPGGNSSSSNVTHSGNTEISSDTANEGVSYSSTTGSENALLVSGGTSTITNSIVTKSGDSSGDEADFYGTNAAIFVYNDAILNINGGSVTTNGSHANGVFAYSTGTINISDTTINTTSNNSGGVMVTGGGTLNASNLNVKTTGNSSAAIRSDRGGGTLTVNGGNYETNGTGSPAIYSTADISVKDASLISTASEGVVVEGANSVSLDGVTLFDTNNTLNGNSETYKNIFLYQSMSGDADEGVASFTAKNSNITTNQGDTIFVTNTTAVITLENNTIVNNSGDLLRVQSGKWGTSGSNGGNVTLSLINQKLSGNIVIDSISSLNLNISNGSVYTGSINNDNTSKNINLTLSSDSTLLLTGDTYITSLTNELLDNSNIYSNGYRLYVNDEEVSINNEEYIAPQEESDDIDIIPEVTTNTEEKKDDNNTTYIIITGVILLVIALIIKLVISIKKVDSLK